MPEIPDPSPVLPPATTDPWVIKQVIVMRHDLQMRRGKQIAQGAHASVAFLTDTLRQDHKATFDSFTEPEQMWMQGLFTKICVRVDSAAELIKIIDDARLARVKVYPITDAGLTEFHGIPTLTCCAIGPDYANVIDPITQRLKLL